jgi:N-methylhydantoinase B
MANWSRVIPTLVDAVLLALAPVMPDRIPAEHLGVLGGIVVFFGVDPRTGERFVTQSIEGGGWGGRPWEDGESAAVSVCQGDVRNAPIEKMELKWPILVLSRELRRDSGGPGKFRGGLGMATQVRGLCEGSWTLADSGRRDFPPQGLFGGRPGVSSDHFLRLPEEEEFKKVNIVRHWVPENAEGIVATAGGGGWGNPLERDPERVRLDVVREYVSLQAARDEYGVVLDEDTLEVNEEETLRLRKKIR